MLFTEREIHRRLEALARRLDILRIDLAIIHHNADLLYFTGTVQDGYLMASSKGKVCVAVRRNITRCEEETPIRPVQSLANIRELKDVAMTLTPTVKRIGFALDVLPVTSYLFFKEMVFPGVEIADIGAAIRFQRAVKSDEEIRLMREAARISHVVYEAVPLFLREGLDEWELCASLEYTARRAGHLGVTRTRNPRLEMYFGHVLSGPDAAVPSYSDSPTGGKGISVAFSQGATRRTMQRGDILSVDTMICAEGYLNDQTRNFSIGHPPDILQRAYHLSLQLHTLFRREARAGTVSGTLYETIWKVVEETPLKPYFMGTDGNRVSFIGHGLGIEVDEFPFIAARQKTVLASGMVVALEPKFIIPEVGIAGIENTYHITAEGAVALNFSPEDLVVIG